MFCYAEILHMVTYLIRLQPNIPVNFCKTEIIPSQKKTHIVQPPPYVATPGRQDPRRARGRPISYRRDEQSISAERIGKTSRHVQILLALARRCSRRSGDVVLPSPESMRQELADLFRTHMIGSCLAQNFPEATWLECFRDASSPSPFRKRAIPVAQHV